MNTQADIRDALDRGLTVKLANVEIVDLRHIMDQYSDHPEPIIQISSVKTVPFNITKFKSGVSAGTTVEVYRLVRGDEKVSEALSKLEG